MATLRLSRKTRASRADWAVHQGAADVRIRGTFHQERSGADLRPAVACLAVVDGKVTYSLQVRGKKRGDHVKAVILAGGLGTRLREETEFRPKPMVKIGGKPILWHIMKFYAHYGIRDFVICVGYKGNDIKEYFLNYDALSSDLTIRLGRKAAVELHGKHRESEWNVSVVDTGLETKTGGRVKQIEPFIEEDEFLVTYGDGLADVDLDALIRAHRSHGRVATVTTVQPTSRFGILNVADDGTVTSFREKPRSEDWVSAGFFVFQRKVFDYLNGDVVLEQEPLSSLTKDGELMAYRHHGFWQPMDTYREFLLLEELWNHGGRPWQVWPA